jgi:hypothetical protein
MPRLRDAVRRRGSLSALAGFLTSAAGVLALPEVQAVLSLPLVRRAIPATVAHALIAHGVAVQAAEAPRITMHDLRRT